MRRWITLWLAVALFVGMLIGDSPTQAVDDLPPEPEAITLRWLEPGALLVRWRQKSDADKTTVMRCLPRDKNVCDPYAEVFDHISGIRYAVIAAQPGDLVRLAEWRYVRSDSDGNVFSIMSWIQPVTAPPYETRLPIVR